MDRDALCSKGQLTKLNFILLWVVPKKTQKGSGNSWGTCFEFRAATFLWWNLTRNINCVAGGLVSEFWWGWTLRWTNNSPRTQWHCSTRLLATLFNFMVWLVVIQAKFTACSELFLVQSCPVKVPHLTKCFEAPNPRFAKKKVQDHSFQTMFHAWIHYDTLDNWFQYVSGKFHNSWSWVRLRTRCADYTRQGIWSQTLI